MSAKPEYLRTRADLEAAALSGTDATALLLLADMAASGFREIEEDEDRALELEQKAAALGHPRAMRRLGDRHSRGRGVSKDPAAAITWWRNAAAAGDVDAMANLASVLHTSAPEEARGWLAVAAAHGQPYAVNVMKNGTAQLPSLAEFAQLSLEEIAAKVSWSGDELAWEVEEVAASLEQLNDLAGMWIERLRARLSDVTSSASIDGDDADFPCPDADDLPEGSIELTIHGGLVHLQLDAINDEDTGWSLTLASFEPHPSAADQEWIVAELAAVAESLGIDF